MSCSANFGKSYKLSDVSSNSNGSYSSDFVPSEDDHLSTVSSDVAIRCLLHLDLQDIMHLSLTSRKWRTLTNDEVLWRALLDRDFGKGIVCYVRDRKLKNAYKENYLRVKELILSFPKANGFILNNSEEKDSSIRKCGLISDKVIDQYLLNLTKNDLSIVFCKSVKHGFTCMIRAILNHSRFEDITANGFLTDLEKLLPGLLNLVT